MRSLAVSCLLLTAGTPAGGNSPAASAEPKLSPPIACRVGTDCFAQQYFDHDPGPGAKDYRCGGRVYDGHDGVDIRLASIAAQRRGVAVLAAADGTVGATRDGEADHLIGSEVDRAGIAGRECGNGVVIEHAGGWQTQYCHMAKGSIAVVPGQKLRAGERLGLVGLSGETQFPHLHFTVRQGMRKVDPFAPDAEPGACSASPGGRMLWTPQATAALAYHTTEIINLGFASGPVTMQDVEAETITRPGIASPALVFFGRAIGAQAGDVARLRLTDPSGRVLVENAAPLDRAKAQWLGFAGRKAPPGGWTKGIYRGSFTIERGGIGIASRNLEISF